MAIVRKGVSMIRRVNVCVDKGLSAQAGRRAVIAAAKKKAGKGWDFRSVWYDTKTGKGGAI